MVWVSSTVNHSSLDRIGDDEPSPVFVFFAIVFVFFAIVVVYPEHTWDVPREVQRVTGLDQPGPHRDAQRNQRSHHALHPASERGALRRIGAATGRLTPTLASVPASRDRQILNRALTRKLRRRFLASEYFLASDLPRRGNRAFGTVPGGDGAP